MKKKLFLVFALTALCLVMLAGCGTKTVKLADYVNYKLVREAGETRGTYTIYVMGDALQGNYIVTFVNGKLTINTGRAGARGTNWNIIDDYNTPLGLNGAYVVLGDCYE